MLNATKAVSPSRRYVAMCFKANFDGFYFRSFTLPEAAVYANNAERAQDYFLQELDYCSCVASVFPAENLADMRPIASDEE